MIANLCCSGFPSFMPFNVACFYGGSAGGWIVGIKAHPFAPQLFNKPPM